MTTVAIDDSRVSGRCLLQLALPQADLAGNPLAQTDTITFMDDGDGTDNLPQIRV